MWSGRELLVASLIGGTEIIEKCLENGIDVNIRRDEDGCSALHLAVFSGNIETVHLLIEAGANVNVVVTTEKFQFTALDIAIISNEIEIASLLFECGSDITCGETGAALYMAVSKGCISMTKLLLQTGVFVDTPRRLGNTLLFNAFYSKAGLLEEATAVNNLHTIVSYLIACGANVNYQDKKGYSPLTLAVLYGDVILVTMLLQAGAQVNTQLVGKSTALHIAARNDDEAIVSMLLQAGADVTIRDELGRYPCNYTHRNIQRMLNEKRWSVGLIHYGWYERMKGDCMKVVKQMRNRFTRR